MNDLEKESFIINTNSDFNLRSNANITSNHEVNNGSINLQHSNHQENKYLIFQLNDLFYGLEIEYVIEIIEYKMPTKVPNLPLFIHGLLNLRGKILPIMDFNLYLGKKLTTITKKTCIIIISCLSKKINNDIGILVDNVLDVLNVQPEILENIPDFSTNIHPKFIKSMFIFNNQIIILLKIDHLFIQPMLEET